MSIDLDAIQARVDAATEGPWGMAVSEDRKWALVLVNPGTEAEFRVARTADDDDANFIAHARMDVPALLAYARDLEARLEAGRARVGELISEQMYGELHYEDLEELRAALTATEGA